MTTVGTILSYDGTFDIVESALSSMLTIRGSRVKFDNGNADQMINLHKPHPGNIVKRYALRQLIEKLVQGGLI